MTKINLSTLFTTPVNSNVQNNPINFNGKFGISTFSNDGLAPYKDQFSTNPLYNHFKSKAEIERLAKSSPRIMELLKVYNLPLRVNMEALEEMR